MRHQCVEFLRLESPGVDFSGNEFIVDQERRSLWIDVTQDRLALLCGHGLESTNHQSAWHGRPINLGDLPRLAEVGSESGGRCQQSCITGHTVGLDVVGMTVPTEIVVGDHHLRANFPNHLDKMSGRLQ